MCSFDLLAEWQFAFRAPFHLYKIPHQLFRGNSTTLKK